MSTVFPGRFTAQIEGDFVLFLIGMRVNHIFAVNKWFPVFAAMPRMITELYKQPALGMLHAQNSISGRVITSVQYWRSFEHLHAYAHDRNAKHLPAWAAFNRNLDENHSVGVWHETYLIRAGNYETIYSDMTLFGLARAANHIPAIGRMSAARTRLNPDAPPDPPEE